MSKKIGVAADHGGRKLKTRIAHWLRQQGYEVEDFGVPEDQDGSVDYPDYAIKLAGAVSRGELLRGVAVCGTGIGMCITANKFPGVRAASAWDEESARLSREHNDANILCLGERSLGQEKALSCLKIWL